MLPKLLLILVVGVVTGFINTNAGGGSLLTLPMLIFLGLPSAVANGTNRLAILFGAISATTNFKKKGIFDWKFGLELAIPALIGAAIGSSIVISLPDRTFKLILSFAMMVMLAVIIINPRSKIEKAFENVGLKKRILAMIAFFFIGIYGGFVQAGVGFIIIATLSLMTGLSLVRINALKVFVVLIYMIFSLTIFIVNGKINLPMGLALATGNAIGAYFGSNFAIAKGDRWIRAILVVAIIAMAIKLAFF
ncbi:MAG: sulfite exporter TauE/SafE family protein [Candidatus Omnitrophica bacterium]|nr:sulfite exporter TauE/SafE family protein [Candidatus Omnitrophota bacterium]